MAPDPDFAPRCDDEHHCVTCGDDGVPMRVERIDEARGLALCSDADGEKATVEIDLVGPVDAGDALLVHAGVALTRLDEAVAEPGRENGVARLEEEEEAA